MIEIGLLGPLTARRDGAPMPLTAPTQRALLALMALNTGVTLSVDRILDAIWGDQPPSGGARTLRFHVSRLRKVAGG